MAERPRKLDAFSIIVQRYLQNHAQNWIFLGHPIGASGAIYVRRFIQNF